MCKGPEYFIDRGSPLLQVSPPSSLTEIASEREQLKRFLLRGARSASAVLLS